MPNPIIVSVILIWLWMGYVSWRAVTKNAEYLRVSHFLHLLFFLAIAPIAFMIAAANGEVDNFNIVVCKRWLSKKEKIELVKKKMTQ